MAPPKSSAAYKCTDLIYKSVNYALRYIASETELILAL